MQYVLNEIGIGASGQVYEVDDSIVFKTCWIFDRPDSSTPESSRSRYASDTLFYFGLLQDERTTLRMLQQRPHRWKNLKNLNFSS